VAASRLRYDSDLSVGFLNFDAGDFLFFCANKGPDFALARRSGFGAEISGAVARSSIVICNSVSANRAGKVVLEVLCASLVVQSSTGKCFVQAMKYKVVLGSNVFWDVLCACLVVRSSTGTCCVQAL
jgi:hypothetical protein